MTRQTQILYEDDCFLASVKPFGTESESGVFLQELCSASGCERLYCVHRIDKACGGLILYAKDRQSAAQLSSLFSSREVEKTYLAVAEGSAASESGRMDDLLFHDTRSNKTYIVDRQRKGVKHASLLYEVLEKKDTEHGALSLYLVRLLTGRTHQVRVQFASRTLPLYGDGRYGSSHRDRSVALWCHRMSFSHPVTGIQLDLAAVPPSDPPWNLFDRFNNT